MQELNIVDKQDNIIGKESRDNIHKHGLLHRESNVYFITPGNGIIFQRRAKTKETSPGLLAATVGGHVEIGDNYEQTAIKETKEETGVELNLADLIFVEKHEHRYVDGATGVINYRFNSRFLYIYRGDLADLQIEENEAEGFELFTFEQLANLTAEEKSNFSPGIVEYILEIIAKFIKNNNLF